MINYWAAHSPVCMFLRPGADCHAMGSWPKGCRVLYFYWQTRREFVRNVRARLGQDIPYPLSVLSSLFPVFFFFLFFEDTKTELACVWVRFWSGRGPGHGIFFCRSSCLCLLFPHRATWHCLRFVSGPGEFQCATISYGKFCYSKHDGLPFIPLTHTHTHTCVSVGRRRQSTERNNNNNKLK